MFLTIFELNGKLIKFVDNYNQKYKIEKNKPQNTSRISKRE
jgi:hypothetical protein